MAFFTNRATLTYNDRTVTSNTVRGEILDPVSLTKTTASETYCIGDCITYVIAIRSCGCPVSGLTLTDDLGAYPFNNTTLVPLTYQEGSLLYYQNGVLQPTPFVSDTSPLTVNGLGIPAGGTAMLIYTVNVNEFAPPAGVITNTATLVVPEGNEVTATETITGECEASLSIVKGISPSTICESGTITYTFTIYNSGSTAITAEDGVVVEDLFDPALSNLTVTINGVSRTGDPTAYTYNAATGAFATLPGAVIVPAATYTQDPVTGAYTVTPGETEIVITGTIGA
ncbi:MAG: hypothetical protein IJY85_02850 [Ruminococcus sp.]|nr:hypothetical protein [Ruminococcus sp.]